MDETFLENSSQFPVKDGVLNISHPHEDGRSEAEILIGGGLLLKGTALSSWGGQMSWPKTSVSPSRLHFSFRIATHSTGHPDIKSSCCDGMNPARKSNVKDNPIETIRNIQARSNRVEIKPRDINSSFQRHPNSRARLSIPYHRRMHRKSIDCHHIYPKPHAAKHGKSN